MTSPQRVSVAHVRSGQDYAIRLLGAVFALPAFVPLVWAQASNDPRESVSYVVLLLIGPIVAWLGWGMVPSVIYGQTRTLQLAARMTLFLILTLWLSVGAGWLPMRIQETPALFGLPDLFGLLVSLSLDYSGIALACATLWIMVLARLGRRQTTCPSQES